MGRRTKDTSFTSANAEFDGITHACPSGSTAVYRRDGVARCACPSGSQCIGRACMSASFARDGSRVQGFPPSCETCSCDLETSATSHAQQKVAHGHKRPPKATPAAIPTENEMQIATTPRALGPAPGSADEQTLLRRECAQSALYSALGFDYNEEYVVSLLMSSRIDSHCRSCFTRVYSCGVLYELV